jgi:hypothetical protein
LKNILACYYKFSDRRIGLGDQCYHYLFIILGSFY